MMLFLQGWGRGLGRGGTKNCTSCLGLLVPECAEHTFDPKFCPIPMFSWLNFFLSLYLLCRYNHTFILTLVSFVLYWGTGGLCCLRPSLQLSAITHFNTARLFRFTEHWACLLFPCVPPTLYCMILPPVYFGSNKRNSLQDLHSQDGSYLWAKC